MTRSGRAPRLRSAITWTEDALASVPIVVWVLILCGLVLRIAVSLAYSPAIVSLSDSGAYVGLADGSLFGDATRTVGYPLFLRALHAVSDQIELTIQAQHLLGIVTALLLYAMVRRLGGPVWAAVLPAVAVLLPIDEIFLEHAIMSETLFTPLTAGAAYAAVRTLDDPRTIRGAVTSRHLWIVLSGVLLALAGWARSIGMPLVPLLVIWMVIALPGGWRARIGGAALAAVSAGVLLFGYAVLQDAKTGSFVLSRAGGWATYARSAPFADCSRFDPPAGTRKLCESTPVDERPGPDFYGHDPASPARQLFGAPPNGNDLLGEFGRRAILSEPLSYLKVVGRDLIRYFDPDFEPQAFSGVGYDLMSLDRRAGGVEDYVANALNAYYADDEYRIHDSVGTLTDIQGVIRVHPLLLLLAFTLAAVGLFLSSGTARRGILLLGGLGFAIMLIPPATVIWSSRYAVPAQGFVVAAGAVGLWAALLRIRRTTEAA